MIFTPNDNVQIVATFDGQNAPDAKAYEAEMREYENSRDFRNINSLMRERSAVKL